MTIKPVIAPTQKRVVTTADTEKKEALGQVVGEQNVHDGHGQSPRRNEVYEELSRSHRRSPQKSPRNKRRDHLVEQHAHAHSHSHGHHHHKRERGERGEKLSTNVNLPVNVGNIGQCQSPHTTNAGIGVAGLGVALGGSGSNSPAHNNNALATLNVNTAGNTKATEQLSARPVAIACTSSAKNQKSQSPAATVSLIKAIEDAYSGYNSGDEHLRPKEAAITAEEWQRRDEQFAKCMNERGYILKNVEEDGACLFRAISLQIYGDEDMHDVIRQHTMDYIYKNREYFSHFVTEDINSYIKRKRRKDSHGNHIEIQAMSEIYNRPVEVYCYKPTPINIFNSEQLNNGYAPMRLSYQRGSHYNAIIDPYNATVGVGLGLAGYKPDLQTQEAVLLSEQLEIEQTMFEDKLKTTDWEATNEAIEEQIARESYLQWCRDNLQRSRNTPATASSTTATITSAEALAADAANASPSKFTLLQQGKEHGANSSSTITSAAAFGLGIGGATATATSAASTVTSASQMLEQTLALGGTASTLSSLTHNQNELGYASDDTDMSSTSSVSHHSGVGGASSGAAGSDNASSKQRLKKSKSRGNRAAGVATPLRTGKKRRCDKEQLLLSNIENDADCALSTGKSTIVTRQSPKPNGSPLYLQSLARSPRSRSRTPGCEQQEQPCTSKQSNTPEKQEPLRALEPQAAQQNEQAKPPSANANYSTFYQELLEASYATDGYGQLSESEMLQRAIQMSTQDYIQDQQRKYLFRP